MIEETKETTNGIDGGIQGQIYLHASRPDRHRNMDAGRHTVKHANTGAD